MPLRRILLIVAVFVTSTSAVVSWEQPADVALTCIRVERAGAQWPAGICWANLPAGPQRVELPGIYDRRWYRPQVGDKITLAFGMEDVGETRLGESAVYTVYLPGIRKDAPRLERVYLGWMGR